MESFGASAPASVLYKHFGFTPERVADSGRAGNASRKDEDLDDDTITAGQSAPEGPD